jgi:hypothetical protein
MTIVDEAADIGQPTAAQWYISHSIFYLSKNIESTIRLHRLESWYAIGD